MTVPALRERWAGHAWTLLPTARDLLLPPRLRAGREHTIAATDDRYGAIELGCAFAAPAGASDAVVLVHGLGGSRQSGYVQRAARVLHAEGFATLALDLRGADRRGGGYYHVALTEDLAAACRSPLLAPFRRLFVLGFSMGGHVAIRFAAAPTDPRVRGVAAWHTPLDLAAAQRHLDAPACALYRRWVLRGLQQIYAAVARRHAVPAPAADVWRCRTIHDWDRLAIAPRYGCASPEAFYRAHSAALVLPDLAIETVLVTAEHDPLVPPAVVLPWIGLARAGRLRLCVLPRGGHLHGPRDAALGLGSGARRGAGPIAQLAAHWRTSSS